MESRKEIEIGYYDKKAEEQLRSNDFKGDFEGFDPFLLESYKFLKDITKEFAEGKKVLDYGCGNGVHSSWLADYAKELTGIDLSEKSLQIAKERTANAKFMKMDAENLNFPDNSFDVVFDGGTFSSLDIEKAFSEIARVLKPDGVLVGIETLGHNPIANLKRRLNEKTGKRTEWALRHIFKMEYLKLAEDYFGTTQAYYFHLVSFLAFPFLGSRWGIGLLKMLQAFDKLVLFIMPFLKRYSFKIVFISTIPKRYEKNI